MTMTRPSKALRYALAAAVAVVFTSNAAALDKNGNFESKQEQDAFIAVTLKKMASEINSQTPVQLDEETRAMSAIALQKTITFNMRLVNYAAFQVDLNHFVQTTKENLNHTVCSSNLNPCCLQRVPAPRAPAHDFSAA